VSTTRHHFDCTPCSLPKGDNSATPVLAPISAIFDAFQLEWIAVTAGGGAAELYSSSGQRYEILLPRMDAGATLFAIFITCAPSTLL